jgi:hypothetical protein
MTCFICIKTNGFSTPKDLSLLGVLNRVYNERMSLLHSNKGLAKVYFAFVYTKCLRRKHTYPLNNIYTL